MIGNASIKSEHAELEDAWVILNGQCCELTLSQGPLINLERRNQAPAPIDT